MLNVYKPNAVKNTYDLSFVWNKDAAPNRLNRFLIDIPDHKYYELRKMPTIREDKYFKVKIENKDGGYRFSLDKHVHGLVVVEIYNGNYWIDCKSFYGN